MLAKLTAKNQLTLPKLATAAIGPVEYFEVEARNGQLILTPVRIQRADAVRARLAELDLSAADIDAAVAWARKGVSEPRAGYAAGRKRAPRSKPRSAKRPGKS